MTPPRHSSATLIGRSSSTSKLEAVGAPVSDGGPFKGLVATKILSVINQSINQLISGTRP